MEFEDFLKDVPNERAFWFNNGIVARNIYEFVNELKLIDDKCFSYHCNDKHDDFASWVGGVLGDIVLAESLQGVKDKKRYISIIEKRIKHLERKNKLMILRNMTLNAIKSWFNKHNIAFKVIIILLVVLVAVLSYTQYMALTNMKLMGDKLRYIEQRDSCFNSYLNQKLTVMESRNYTPIEITCPKDYTLIINNPDLEELPSRVSQDDITVYNDRIIINIENSSWAIFKNTSSMIPILNHNTKAIELKPEKMSDINIGDIVSYTSGNDIIVHRVVGKERDTEGYYLVTKGDNNQAVDPEKVRFEQVQGIVVMLVY